MNVTDILDAVVSLAGITVQLDRYVIGARRREGPVLKEPACTPTDERNAFLTRLQLDNALVRVIIYLTDTMRAGILNGGVTGRS